MSGDDLHGEDTAHLRRVGLQNDESDDEGSAIVEFVWLAVLLMVPLVYVLLTVFAVQRTSYGLAAATREGGRAFVTAPSGDAASARAQAAADLVLRDNGVAASGADLDITCSADPCLTPGALVRVRLERSVPLPLVPSFLRGHLPDAVSVSGEHVEVVDRYRPVRP